MHLRTDTASNAHFARVPTISHSRNAFTVAEKHISTMQFDALYPMYHKFIYPGDTLSVTHKSLARLQTQIAVLYDDLYLDAHAWFVPMRLIQTNWARYQFNAQPDGPSQDNSALTSPKLDLSILGAGGFPAKSRFDYFGYPTGVSLAGATAHINNYLGRAYNLIWNLNYRDENLQQPLTVDLGDGPDNPSNYQSIQSRGKRHDIFTSCLTAQQKGTAVTIPMGLTAPITRVANATSWHAYKSGSNVNAATGGDIGLLNSGGKSLPFDGASGLSFDPNGGLIADLATVAATWNQARQSLAVQHLLEADMRGGTRDVEAIQNRWGVTVPDFRIQRPEFLGSTTWTFDGHVVPQTSESATTPQGTLTQFSQTMNSFSINHSFQEHGVFMILISARSNITYQQGLQKELSYMTRYDWYQPEFANLGEVAVKNKEIYFQNTSADDNTFGFQEYAYELRYGLNRVSAEMRSNYALSLDSRHMAEDYVSLPTLSSSWIPSYTPISRNIAVASSVSDPIEINQIVQGKIARTLPMYSIPGLTRF